METPARRIGAEGREGCGNMAPRERTLVL